MSLVGSADRDLAAKFDSAAAKYPLPVRLAIIIGISTVLWGVIIVGGWGLYSLIA
jgi:hypothetical protein